MFNWGRLKLEISISDDLFSHGWKGVIREGAVFRQQLLAISSLMGVVSFSIQNKHKTRC